MNDSHAPKLYYYSYSKEFDNANCTYKPMEKSQFYVQSWGECCGMGPAAHMYNTFLYITGTSKEIQVLCCPNKNILTEGTANEKV
jgi:hypothetical protein